MSNLSQSSCYRILLSFAASTVVAFLGLSALAEESATADESKTATRAKGIKSDGVDDKPSQTGAKPADRSAEPASVSPEGESPVTTTATASGTGQACPLPVTPAKAAAWHKIQLRITGSMCMACLKELQDDLSRVPGVYRVKIERPQITNYFQPISPDITSWANAVVIFDSERLPLEYLRGAIKQSGYHSYHVVDRLLGHEPEERDLKI